MRKNPIKAPDAVLVLLDALFEKGLVDEEQLVYWLEGIGDVRRAGRPNLSADELRLASMSRWIGLRTEGAPGYISSPSGRFVKDQPFKMIPKVMHRTAENALASLEEALTAFHADGNDLLGVFLISRAEVGNFGYATYTEPENGDVIESALVPKRDPGGPEGQASLTWYITIDEDAAFRFEYYDEGRRLPWSIVQRIRDIEAGCIARSYDGGGTVTCVDYDDFSEMQKAWAEINGADADQNVPVPDDLVITNDDYTRVYRVVDVMDDGEGPAAFNVQLSRRPVLTIEGDEPWQEAVRRFQNREQYWGTIWEYTVGGTYVPLDLEAT